MALIGSVLVDREMLAAVGEIVRPNDFYAHVHETIFMVLVELYERGEPVDKITVAEELKRRSVLERVGGLSYISALMDTVQTAASARYYATIVREKSVLRSLIHAGTEITGIGYEGEEDVAGALDRSEQLVYKIGERRGVTEFMPVSRLMKDAFDHIDRLYHMRGDRTGTHLRLPRHRRNDDRLSARQLRDRCGPAGHGQELLRPQHGRLCGSAGGRADRVLFARNVEQRADPALDLFGSAHFDESHAPRQHQRRSVGADLQRDGSDQRSADLPRRYGCADRQRRAQSLPAPEVDRRAGRGLHRLLATAAPRRARAKRQSQ